MTQQKSSIVDALAGLAVPIKNLVPDASNVRKHGERSISSIRASLSKFGQRKPIIVQKDGMVVRAGNGTLEAAKLLGWTHVAAVVIDDDNLTATQYAIADNRTAELSEWDWQDLGQTLRELGDVPDLDLAELGWDTHEVENLLKADWEPPAAEASDGTEFADSKSLTLKFTDKQVQQLEDAIDGEVTAEAVVAAVVR